MFDEGLQFYDLRGISGLRELPRNEQDPHSPPIFLPNGGSIVYGDIVSRIIYVSHASFKVGFGGIQFFKHLLATSN